jgi:hypothetical protein
MRSHSWILIFFATGFLAGVGCSNGKLTRPEAKSKLDKWYETNFSTFSSDNIDFLLVAGTVSDNCFSPYLLRPVSDEDDYKLFTRLGLVTIQPEHALIATVSLTEAAKKASSSGPYGHHVKKNCDSSQYTLPLTMFAGTDVTGIQQEGTNAKVEYRACQKLTPLGKTVRDLHLSDQGIRFDSVTGLYEMLEIVGKQDSFCKYKNTHFAKYDDGWRMDQEPRQ